MGIGSMRSNTMIVGLTGGIGCGKTTVAHYFAGLGVPVIDADQIAHELVGPTSKLLSDLVNRFGPAILTAQGGLDRAALRQIIFEDSRERLWLESLLHPLIEKVIEQQMADLTGSYAIVLIPLLAEKGKYEFLDRILVVDAPETLQIQRTMQRDGISEAEVQSVLKAQARRDQRLALASEVITNDGDLAHIEKQVLVLHHKYMKLSKR